MTKLGISVAISHGSSSIAGFGLVFLRQSMAPQSSVHFEERPFILYSVVLGRKKYNKLCLLLLHLTFFRSQLSCFCSFLFPTIDSFINLDQDIKKLSKFLNMKPMFKFNYLQWIKVHWPCLLPLKIYVFLLPLAVGFHFCFRMTAFAKKCDKRQVFSSCKKGAFLFVINFFQKNAPLCWIGGYQQKKCSFLS